LFYIKVVMLDSWEELGGGETYFLGLTGTIGSIPRQRSKSFDLCCIGIKLRKRKSLVLSRECGGSI